MKAIGRKIRLSILILLFLGIFLVATKKDYIPFIDLQFKTPEVWSIGVYKFDNNDASLRLLSHNEAKNPVLTAEDISDRKAQFVADPFLVYEDGVYYMFFEICFEDSRDIGLATSKDAIKWQYERIILDEPFHLSYPCVFKWGEDYYMLPESAHDNSIRLYKAEQFPYKWRFTKRLIEGKGFRDPTIFRHQDRWWLFTTINKNDNLHLYYADKLEGPWTEHPKNPIIKDNGNIARPAGNLIYLNGKMIRFAQDDSPAYGNSVRAFEILKLDTTDYKEKELEESPLLEASGKDWNKDGMHHLSIYQVSDKESIAIVDGKRDKKEYGIYVKLPKVLGKFSIQLVKD